MERMLRKKKDNSEYEIDRELTGKFAIEKNYEYQERIAELEEENKNLKEKVETLELWLDNKEKLNEKYRKEIDKYKRPYEHSMGFMEEDTLQELKDIGELGDDELIYEEGLYD